MVIIIPHMNGVGCEVLIFDTLIAQLIKNCKNHLTSITTHDLNYEVIQVYNTQFLNTNTGG